MLEFAVKTTKEQQFINITDIVLEALSKSKVNDGIAVIFCPHTTAGITINENADPDVVKDIISGLNKAFPVKNNYLHMEGNSHAHIKASFMGASATVIIKNGKLQLGTWQGIYLCEFDGPRNRRVFVKLLG